jgi:ABC-type antimicrobial peptide transport system permease subunit
VAHQQVAVISAALAGRLFRAADPVGEWIRVNNSTNPRLGRVQIVGVSRDAKLADLHSREPQFIFMPILQASSQAGRTPTAVEIALSASSAAVQAPIRRAIESLGQDYVWRQSTLVDQVERSLLRERLLASGGYGFGALALIVVGLGICGVLASSVSARTREIGIRATLGATVGELQWMVLKQALRVAGLAILLGLPCVWLAGRTVAASLTGIRPHDSLSIAAAVAVAIGMCVAAAWLPARRAAAVSPMEALQTE